MQVPLHIQVTGQRCEALEVVGVLFHANRLHPLYGAVTLIAFNGVLAWAWWLCAPWIWARVYVELEVLEGRLPCQRTVPFRVLPYAFGSSVDNAVIALPGAGGLTDEVQFCTTLNSSVAWLWALLLTRLLVNMSLVVQVSLKIIVAGIPCQS